MSAHWKARAAATTPAEWGPRPQTRSRPTPPADIGRGTTTIDALAHLFSPPARTTASYCARATRSALVAVIGAGLPEAAEKKDSTTA